MTRKTLELINRLSQLVDTNKYLILSGGIGVGKTFLASAVAENCALSRYCAQGELGAGIEKYEVETEIVPIHPSRAYEDFVAGISISTENGKAVFRHEDNAIKEASERRLERWFSDNADKFSVKRNGNIIRNGKRVRGYSGIRVREEWRNSVTF